MTPTTPLRALYYPFSRSLSPTTLKRAVLLYDEILFVDPASARVRDGRYEPREHLAYLPPNVATSLAADWSGVREEYSILEREGLLRLVDPEETITDSGSGQLIARALAADLSDLDLRGLFDGYPRMWSMLRTRIPQPAFAHLAHQVPARVLGADNVLATAGGPLALYLDGHPQATPTLDGVALPDDGQEYAALLPYLAGSSIATSTAIAVALAEQAVPLTDSDEHFRLLSARMARAADAVSSLASLPGLASRRASSAETAQRTSLVHQRVVDSVISHDDWDALTFTECVRYRDATHDERAAFRSFLAEVVTSAYAEPWSSKIEEQIESRITDARHEIRDHAAKMRDTYRNLFGRVMMALTLSDAPALVTAAFPGVSPLTALLFGGGAMTAVLTEPVKEISSAWIERDRGESSLADLMDLPRPHHPTH